MLKRLNPKHIGWRPYFYLFYLGFLFIQPILDPDYSVRNWSLTLLSIVVFLPMYFLSFIYKRNARVLPLTAIALLGFVCSLGVAGFYNSGASTYFIYAAAASPYAFRGRGLLLFLGLLVGLIVAGFFLALVPFEARLYVYIPSLIFSLFVAGLNAFEAERERSSAKLELAQSEIEQLATIAERERIARDLHDLLGHTLSVITLKSELASKLIDKDTSKAKKEIQEVERISRETLAEVRSAVTGYRQRGLMAEIASAKLALEAANVSFGFKGDVQSLNALQESTLSLVLREAVTNIIRHAKASRCFVELRESKETLEFEIRDNGIGMQSAVGNGLAGIRERVMLLGGKFDMQGSQGTQLLIVLLKDNKRHSAQKRHLNLGLEA